MFIMKRVGERTLVLFSNDFTGGGGWGLVGPPGVNTGETDPLGGTDGWKIEDGNISFQENIHNIDNALPPDSNYEISLFVQEGTATTSRLQFDFFDDPYDPSFHTQGIVDITWLAGSPILVASGGGGAA